MGFSLVEIANGALTHCGEPSITSLDQDGKAARILKRNMDLVRKRVLTKYRWNFAKKRAELAADPTAPAFGFTYKHQVPSDFLQLIGLYDAQEPLRNYSSSDANYKLEGQFILSESTPVKIFYVADITDASQYDPSFAAVFEYYLATKIFYDLTKGTERYTALVREREQAVKEAKFSAAIQNTPEVIMSSDWIDSRFADVYAYRIGPVI
jgi:hypothetical protein